MATTTKKKEVKPSKTDIAITNVKEYSRKHKISIKDTVEILKGASQSEANEQQAEIFKIAKKLLDLGAFKIEEMFLNMGKKDDFNGADFNGADMMLADDEYSENRLEVGNIVLFFPNENDKKIVENENSVECFPALVIQINRASNNINLVAVTPFGKTIPFLSVIAGADAIGVDASYWLTNREYRKKEIKTLRTL